MPIYVYQCEKCGVQFECKQKIADQPLKDCPECDGSVSRVFQPVGIVFKGSGWYCTDNRAKSPTALPGESKSNGNGSKASEESSSTKEPEKSVSKTPGAETPKD